MSRPALITRKRDKSGRVPTMKGCLKLKSPLASPSEETPSSSSVRKTVAFGEEGTEEVYFADVWDRTPTEPARKLTYQDLLELKEIQRSLPRANQPSDPISGRPASHYLQDVPIGLLPLLSDCSSSPSSQESSMTSSPVASPPPTPSGLSNPPWVFPFPPTPQIRGPPAPGAQAWVPPHMAHLAPKRPAQVRQKPTFAFLPLLDTPPSSGASSPYASLPSTRSPSPDHERESQSDADPLHDPPTPSLTNASLDSSPLSRASIDSPEPSFLQLPPLHGRKIDEYGDELYNSYSSSSSFSDGGSGGGLMRLSPRIDSLRFDTSRRLRMRSSSPPPPPPSTAWHAFPTQPKKRHTSVSPARSDRSTMSTMSSISCSSTGTSGSECPPAPRRRRNVMIVNGIEIDLDDDSDSEGEVGGGSSSHSTSKTSTPGASGSPSRCGTPPPLPLAVAVDEERQSYLATTSLMTPNATPSPPAPCTPTRQSPCLPSVPIEHLDVTPRPPTPTPTPNPNPTTAPSALPTPIASPIRTPTETPPPSCSPSRCSVSLYSPIRFQRDAKSAAAYQRVQKQGLASS